MKEIDESFIINAISDYYKIPVDVIMSITRRSEIILPRYISIYFCKVMTKKSFLKIGYSYPIYKEKSRHAKMLYAYNIIKGRCEIYHNFNDEVIKIEKHIKELFDKHLKEIEEQELNEEFFTYQLNDCFKN